MIDLNKIIEGIAGSPQIAIQSAIEHQTDLVVWYDGKVAHVPWYVAEELLTWRKSITVVLSDFSEIPTLIKIAEKRILEIIDG